MPAILIGAIFIFAVLCLALYGLVKLLSGLVSKPESTESFGNKAKSTGLRSLKQDVEGASHLLNFLYQKNRLERKDYERLRGFLDKEYGEQWELADHLPPVAKRRVAQAKQTKSDDKSKATDKPKPETETKIASDVVPSKQSEQPVVASLATEPTVKFPSSTDGRTAGAGRPQSPAPWEIPDPPAKTAKTPRRSFSEVMSGFMHEKNIRWGELASGILIVGSAVGLVVSLRE